MSTRPTIIVISIAVALAFAPGVQPAAASLADTPWSQNESVEVTAVYPNPLADGDAGEFVVLRVDGPTENWTLSDGENRVRLPNLTVDGRLVLSTAPNRTRNLTTGPVHGFGSDLALANGGDSLTLARDGRSVATLSWADTPEGELGRPTDDGIEWSPVGATHFRPITARGGQVRPFVLPDAAGLPVEVLAGAERRVLLGGYTLTSKRVVDTLRNASQRGVRVVVLVDDSPVGGMTRRQARALDRLVAANVTVRVIGGERARYAFHHAKYAVVDDRALVTTENWKPAGVGGHSSRGWGVVVKQRQIVRRLTAVFRADFGGRDTQPWRQFRADRSFQPADTPPANATFPSRFEPGRARVETVSLLVAPDNAERRLVARIENATESIRVQQVAIGGRRQPFLRAVLRAARRGVEVDILLSNAWYVRKDNRALVRWLNERAAREGLQLEARLADPRGRYEKIHAKGLLVDGDTAVVGSLNWNNHSARQNREVVLVLHGQRAATYYRQVFRADWRGGVWRLTIGLLLVVVFGWLVAGLVATRFEFEEPDGGKSSGYSGVSESTLQGTETEQLK